MKAMILAAGEGTRLKPLTLDTPKVILPVNGVPQIAYTLNWLRAHGVYEVGINLHYLGWKIRDYLGDGSEFGVSITYSEEASMLGTAGGIKKLESFFNETFIVVYGDVLTDFNLTGMLQFHRDMKGIATLALYEALHPADVGIVRIDEKLRVIEFIEKPLSYARNGGLVNAGVYILEKEILTLIPEASFCDFGHDVLPNIIQSLPVYGYCLAKDDYLLDIGKIETYQKANEDIRNGILKIQHG